MMPFSCDHEVGSLWPPHRAARAIQSGGLIMTISARPRRSGIFGRLVVVTAKIEGVARHGPAPTPTTAGDKMAVEFSAVGWIS
jgi:hypothetical protein